jgi:hypothetical protein
MIKAKGRISYVQELRAAAKGAEGTPPLLYQRRAIRVLHSSIWPPGASLRSTEENTYVLLGIVIFLSWHSRTPSAGKTPKSGSTAEPGEFHHYLSRTRFGLISAFKKF